MLFFFTLTYIFGCDVVTHHLNSVYHYLNFEIKFSSDYICLNLKDQDGEASNFPTWTCTSNESYA